MFLKTKLSNLIFPWVCQGCLTKQNKKNFLCPRCQKELRANFEIQEPIQDPDWGVYYPLFSSTQLSCRLIQFSEKNTQFEISPLDPFFLLKLQQIADSWPSQVLLQSLQFADIFQNKKRRNRALQKRIAKALDLPLVPLTKLKEGKLLLILSYSIKEIYEQLSMFTELKESYSILILTAFGSCQPAQRQHR